MTRLVRRVVALFRKGRLDRDLEKEIAGHLELAERDALARGLSVEDARREARQVFGGLDAVREAHRDARSVRAIETLWRDTRYALRGMVRTPMVCATVVLVLGVAIGANVAMFTTLRSIVLRPLAYANADDLVIVMHDGRSPVSYANFESWRREARGFTAMGAAEYWQTNVGLDDGVDRVLGLRVTQDTLPLLGVAPLHGRLPGPDAFDGGDGRQVVISHQLWQSRFGSDPGAVGRTIRLDGNAYTVVAVMPAGFVFAPFWAVDAQLWAPLPIETRTTDRTSNSLRIFARLAPGTSIAAAQAEIDAITARLEALAPATNRNVRVVSLKERVVGDTRLSLLVFMAGVGVVLVIACANVAHMLLARAATRRREVAVRLALGATRLQIVRQFLVESIVLAGAGALLGTLLAGFGIRMLVAYAPSDLPRSHDIHTDGIVLLFTVIVAVTAGVAFGLVPALQAARPVPGEHLAAGRGASADQRQSRVWQGLMISEVALSLVLVAAAGLMVRSFAALQAEDPGFDPSGVLAFSVSVEGSASADPSRRVQFFTELTERLAAAPGVAAVSAINHLPLEGDLWTRSFAIEGRPVAAPGEGPGAIYRVSLPGYFDVMKLPLVRGRDFTWQDTASAPGVVILSDNLARRHWPGEDALGKRLVVGSPLAADAQWLTVVGIVADAARDSWEGGRGEEMYLPYLQERNFGRASAPRYTYLTFVAREEKGQAGALAPHARAIVSNLDRDAAFSDVMTMDEAASRALARPRFQRTLLALCALVALLLAAAGIHGVVNYGVTRRGREIGLRMALGAQRAEIGSLVVRQSVRHVLVGLAAGWIGTLLLTRLMTGLLHGVTPGDPTSLLGATAVLLLVAVVASALPAWRASRVDPVVAMRE